MKDQQPSSSGLDVQQGFSVSLENAQFVRLRGEQRMIQLGRYRKNRTRSLERYSEEFGLGKTGLLDIIGHALVSGNRFVFADMGCGNGLALREALLLADGFEARDTTSIFGVDVLDVDKEKIHSVVRENPTTFPRQLLDNAIDPKIYAADMDTFLFPEPADLVTFSNSLYYTGDPARAITNALGQTNPGGILCINGITHLRRMTMAGSVPLIACPEQLSKDFEVVRAYDTLVLKRNYTALNHDEIEGILFGGPANLKHKIATTERMLYEYHYEVQLPTPQTA